MIYNHDLQSTTVPLVQFIIDGIGERLVVMKHDPVEGDVFLGISIQDLAVMMGRTIVCSGFRAAQFLVWLAQFISFCSLGVQIFESN